MTTPNNSDLPVIRARCRALSNGDLALQGSLENAMQEGIAIGRAERHAIVDPTDPGHDVEVLREHVRHLERRVRDLIALLNDRPAAAPVDARRQALHEADVRQAVLAENEACALIVCPVPHVEEERECSAIAELIRSRHSASDDQRRIATLIEEAERLLKSKNAADAAALAQQAETAQNSVVPE